MGTITSRAIVCGLLWAATIATATDVFGQKAEVLPAEAKPAATPATPSIERQRVLYTVRNGSAERIAKALSSVFRAAGTKEHDAIVEAVDQNLLIAGSPTQLADIARMLDELDKPPQSVTVEFWIVGFPSPGAAKPGAAKPGHKGPQADAAKRSQPDKPDDAAKPGDERVNDPTKPALKSKSGSTPLYVDATRNQVFAAIQEMQKRGEVEVLDHLELTTVENQPARSQVGERVSTMVGRTFTARGERVGNMQMESVGTLASATPRIDAQGRILLDVTVEKSALAPEREGPLVGDAPAGDMRRGNSIQLMAKTMLALKPDEVATLTLMSRGSSGGSGTQTQVFVTARLTSNPAGGKKR